MYYDQYGNSYKYMDVMPDGTKIYHNGMVLSKDRKERLDYIISRAWDNLPDEKKIEINNKIMAENKAKKNSENIVWRYFERSWLYSENMSARNAGLVPMQLTNC